MTFSLTVPSNAETLATGFVMGGKKTIYRQEWQTYYNRRRKQGERIY